MKCNNFGYALNAVASPGQMDLWPQALDVFWVVCSISCFRANANKLQYNPYGEIQK